MKSSQTKILNIAVVVAALGYFVDIYDLVLFSIVRKPSLMGLGLSGQDLFDDGVLLLNMQMAGMLVGGIFWGVLGDKRGRLSVLFGSIFAYSAANIANGFVQTVEQYAILRFIAGIGLAGELGAGITLVTEVLPKEIRGWGTMIVATVGVSGAILAGALGEIFDWRTCYFIGGGLGFMLLFLRIGVYESGLYSQLTTQKVARGNFLSLFTNWDRFVRYLRCILIGLPIWYVIGILVTFSPEFSKFLEVTEEITGAKAIMYTYVGLVLGDFLSGFLSQVLKSRRKVIFLFLSFTALAVTAYFGFRGLSAAAFYGICIALGFASGYWAVFVTIAAEQFGTNLRATVATTVPNFVRGSVVLVTHLFILLKDQVGMVSGGIWVGVLVMTVAFLSAVRLPETFNKELNYLE